MTPASTASSTGQAAENRDPQSHGGLSNTAKIGLAVGMTVLGGVLILCTLLFCSSCKRKRQRQRNDAEKSNPRVGGFGTMSELSAPEVYRGVPAPTILQGQATFPSVHPGWPAGPVREASRTPNQRTNERLPSCAELEGDMKTAVHAVPPHPKAIYELPSPS